ncbi:hypothetical protein BGI41_01585 [Methanobrevibacter sp. 87.7]|uniref:zinc ribbon domain-containing protein n=1 Tax=Methanobrevibacter sp. 87.7 TaxID=387957 RepID=UPI000B4FE0BB|nr:zinc ribbon domain-containing protein [Methanobrevibacter sp. 87.7]OWT33603.1 hypothetical protein BGI41_01585 [Methanobrevibacter sp. 87.7]
MKNYIFFILNIIQQENQQNTPQQSQTQQNNRNIAVGTSTFKSNFGMNCGCKLKEGAIFCPNCGVKIQDDEELKCPNCDFVVSKDDNFCMNCGFKLK